MSPSKAVSAASGLHGREGDRPCRTGSRSTWASSPDWLVAIVSGSLPGAQLPGLRLVCSEWAELIMRGIESARAPANMLPRLGARCQKLTTVAVTSLSEGCEPDIAALGGLSCLASLDLSGCGASLSDRGMQALACLQGTLTSLNISGCSEISDQGLQAVENLQAMRVLGLSAVTGVTGFHGLSGLSALSDLDISHNPQMTTDILSGCLPSSLTTLNIGSCGHMCSRGLRRLLEPLQSLRGLQLSEMDEFPSSELQEAVCSLTGLLGINFSHNSLSSSAMRQIASRLTGLLSLDLSGCSNIWGSGLSLGAIANLQTLRLAGCTQLRGADLCHVARLTSLTALDLTGCAGLCSEAFLSLGSLGNLKTLSVGRCPGVTDQTLSSLCASLPGLTSLDASDCCSLSAEGLRQLCGSDLRGLKYLKLSHTNVDSQGVAVLCSTPSSLHQLCINGCAAVGNSGLEGIQLAAHLTELGLEHLPEVTDTGLLHLSCLQGLGRLDLSHCSQLTEAGIAEFMRRSESIQLKVHHDQRPSPDDRVGVLGRQHARTSATGCPAAQAQAGQRTAWSLQMFPLLPAEGGSVMCSEDFMGASRGAAQIRGTGAAALFSMAGSPQKVPAVSH